MKLCLSYKKPTPLKIRNWCNALKASFLFLSGYQMFLDHKTISYLFLILTAIAIFINEILGGNDV